MNGVDLYVVRVRDAQAGGSAFQQVSRFQKPAGKYPDRGLAASSDARSGYVGIQGHSSAAVLRQIRVKA